MLSGSLNSLALMRFGGFRLGHGGGGGGFAWLVMGLAAIATGFWFFSRTGENAQAKN